MPKAGGTFTGEVKHKKDIIIEPTMPSRFITFKNRYATNADGSDAGAGGTAFGVNFDLDHGNSGYNQVKFSCRYGNVLSVNGGTGRGAKYEGAITDSKHLVNKYYVDEFYVTQFVRPLSELSTFLYRIIDTKIIDGIVNASGQLFLLVGGLASFRMSGSVHRYGMAVVLGVIVLIFIILV